MKTIKIVFTMFIAALSSALYCQTTTIGNNSSTPSDYLGWDNFTTFDLNVKHEANRNIIFSTNNIAQMGISNAGFVVSGATGPIDNALLSVNIPGSASVKRALYAFSNQGTCAHFIADNGTFNVGFGGIATGAATTRNVGVAGSACHSGLGGGSFAIFGQIENECTGASFAGYFDGKTFCTAGVWTLSDAILKEQVQPLENASALVNLIQPKQYIFEAPEGVKINLPQGLQYGVLANELEEVMPSAVTDVVHAVSMEDMAAAVEDFNFKGVDYQQLIPVLVAYFQEEAQSLLAQEEQIAILEQHIEHLEVKRAMLIANQSKQD